MNCDPIARLYRWIEYAVFGKSLQRRRKASLGSVPDARRVLALGDGDGRALVTLLQSAPEAHVTYVDVSAKMLKLARSRTLAKPENAERVEFRQHDARVLPLEQGRYDVIVTHFFLDCFDESDLPWLIDKIASAAAPEARWIISEFRPAHRFAGLLIPVMYAFFGRAAGLKTRRLIDHHPHLSRNGFRLRQSEHTWDGMLASELWVRQS